MYFLKNALQNYQFVFFTKISKLSICIFKTINLYYLTINLYFLQVCG